MEKKKLSKISYKKIFLSPNRLSSPTGNHSVLNTLGKQRRAGA